MTRWFITGTDTGVGKTVVTTCLAQAAAGEVRAIKPVESGVPAGAAHGEDTTRLAEAAGHPPLNALRFEAPLSPHRAARIEGHTVDLSAVASWIRQVRGDVVLVEGAGGWRVPWMRALCEATEGPVLVVAANRLGVLNHTLLTVESILGDGFDVAGVVLNSCGLEPDSSAKTNLEDLRELLEVPVVELGSVETEDQVSRARCGRELWRALS